MQLRFTEADEKFRGQVSDWLSDNLSGDFAVIRHRGGPGDEHVYVEERKAWEGRLAEGGLDLYWLARSLGRQRRNHRAAGHFQ